MDQTFSLNKKYVNILILCAITFTILTHTMELETQETPHHLKLPQELSMTTEQAHCISKEASTSFPRGIVVLVQSSDQTYHYAILEFKFNDSDVLIRNCATDKLEMVSLEKLRSLEFLIQITLQPHPPKELITNSFHLFYEPTLAEGASPSLEARILLNSCRIIVIGDLHGDSTGLRHILKNLYLSRIINKKGILASNAYLVFTGDLTDRGPYGPEVWTLIMELKNLNKDQVYTLRGNHESLEMATLGNFFKQLKDASEFNDQNLSYLLQRLFNSMPLGLFCGVAPQPHNDAYNAPYHFLFFCHGGIDPMVNLKYLIQKAIQLHKRSGQVNTLQHLLLHYPETSGLLWTDFCSNRTTEEPARRIDSSRGANSNMLNASATLDFFDEHSSNLARHPYILDAIVRGHQHLEGIARLKLLSPEEEQDWKPIHDMRTEAIEQGSIYTCIASTKWLFYPKKEQTVEAYAEITFDQKTNKWQMTPHITKRVSHKPNIR